MIETNTAFDQQVAAFHREVLELIKKYQFRDRSQMSCCGISVSQCYLLEALHRQGPLTMNQLAEALHLSISTVTRVVDQLVLKQYVSRTEGADDRRVRLIQLTEAGERVYQQAWESVFASERTILEQFPEEHREMLIVFLRKLNQAVDHWQACCR
ncbi:MAG: MarR family transcriptional regulator [Calditrichaeota bacterium]|nr:MarR family transcriptional regulator [Calditrichota bacterium]MCB0295777.1 MarR family transcriptional regulator [Calditrichota bacterium]